MPDPDGSRVVLIGTAQYQDAGLYELKQVTNNLGALRDLLTEPGRGGFLPKHCHLLANPLNIKELDSHLFEIAGQAEDVLVIYFSGHGLVDVGERQLYLCMAATEPSMLLYTALALRRIKFALLKSSAKIKILILDCCYSGRAGSEIMMTDGTTFLDQEIPVQGVYVLSSAPAYDVAVTDPDADYTAFTGSFLQLLGDGVPNDAATLTLADLYPHLKRALVSRNYPEPQQWIHSTAGDIVLVKNGAAVLQGTNPPVTMTVPSPEYDPDAGGGAAPFQPGRVGVGHEPLPRGSESPQATADHEERLRELIELTRQADQPADSGINPDAVVTELRKIVTEMISLTRPEHPEVLAARDILAFWLGRAGNPKDAARMYERLADAREHSLGPDHEAVMATRHNQAHWTGPQDPAGAVALFERVVADRTRVLGEEHPDTLSSLAGLAYWTGASGDADGALFLYRGLADQQQWQHGDMHEAVLDTRYYLAQWIGKTGNAAEAAKIYEDLAVRWESKLGAGCPNSIACREKSVYWKQQGQHGAR